MGTMSGTQVLEVKANTVNGAYEQLEKIYGVKDPINMREVHEGNSSSSSSSGDGITLEGLLALAALGIGGFAAFVAIMTLWVFLPELLLGVGAFAAFKGGKAINNRGFQRNTKIGMITTLAVISTVLPYLGGMEAHKAVEFDRNSYIEEVKQDWKEFNS